MQYSGPLCNQCSSHTVTLEQSHWTSMHHMHRCGLSDSSSKCSFLLQHFQELVKKPSSQHKRYMEMPSSQHSHSSTGLPQAGVLLGTYCMGMGNVCSNHDATVICAYVEANHLVELGRPFPTCGARLIELYRISRNGGIASFCTTIARIHRHRLPSVWRGAKRHLSLCNWHPWEWEQAHYIHRAGAKFIQDLYHVESHWSWWGCMRLLMGKEFGSLYIFSLCVFLST